MFFKSENSHHFTIWILSDEGRIKDSSLAIHTTTTFHSKTKQPNLLSKPPAPTHANIQPCLTKPSVKNYKNRDKVGFHFSCFLNRKIHILTHNQRFLSRHPYHNNISLKDKTAKPALQNLLLLRTQIFNPV
jgi:hypothetical protein